MVLIREKAFRLMLRHACQVLPNEACGLLVGRNGVVWEAWPANNEQASPDSFRIPDHELIEAFRRIRSTGLELVGIFHSHPTGPAVPSTRDFEEFYYPAAACWVVSLQQDTPVVRCFRWTKDGFAAVEYEVEAEPGQRPGVGLSEEKSVGIEKKRW